MTLQETLQKVREENLTKIELEHYHLQLSSLYGDLKLEIAGLKKEKAIFLAQDPTQSVAQRKIAFDASKSGQRLLELEGYASATSMMLGSLKSRMYSQY